MTLRYAAICAGAVLAAVALQGTSVHALTMAECSVKYKAAKDANTLNGMKWKDFRKANCGAEASAAPSARIAAGWSRRSVRRSRASWPSRPRR